MNRIILILVFVSSNVANAQSKFYTSFGSGLTLHKVKNKEDSKTSDFILHQKENRSERYKYSIPLHFQLGYLISNHWGIEISLLRCHLERSWWCYGYENRNCNRDIHTYNNIFPLSVSFRNKISERFNYKLYAGGFINYVPTYYYRTYNANLNVNVPDRFFDESFIKLEGKLIQMSDLGKEVIIDYKLNKPLINKIQYGYTAAIQLGYDISSSLNLFLQIQGYKTITDLENKNEITMTRTFRNGTEDNITLNYYSNMYKQFYAREPNDINNRPKSTVSILNTVLGIRYNFRNRKNNDFIIQ